MFRKYLSFTFACALLVFSASVFVSAQTGQLRGIVVIKQADGTSAPAPGAAVVVYRTDISGKYEIKTNKAGEFVFAGLPFVGTYLITVSGPGQKRATSLVAAMGNSNDGVLVTWLMSARNSRFVRSPK